MKKYQYSSITNPFLKFWFLLFTLQQVTTERGFDSYHQLEKWSFDMQSLSSLIPLIALFTVVANHQKNLILQTRTFTYFLRTQNSFNFRSSGIIPLKNRTSGFILCCLWTLKTRTFLRFWNSFHWINSRTSKLKEFCVLRKGVKFLVSLFRRVLELGSLFY